MAREITFFGRTVVVRQLTVRETEAFFNHVGDVRITTADLLMNRTLPAVVVCTATGLTVEELNGDVTPSELTALWEAVEAENPSFLQTIERLAGLEQKAESLRAKVSAKQPASLPDPVTARA